MKITFNNKRVETEKAEWHTMFSPSQNNWLIKFYSVDEKYQTSEYYPTQNDAEQRLIKILLRIQEYKKL